MRPTKQLGRITYRIGVSSVSVRSQTRRPTRNHSCSGPSTDSRRNSNRLSMYCTFTLTRRRPRRMANQRPARAWSRKSLVPQGFWVGGYCRPSTKDARARWMLPCSLAIQLRLRATTPVPLPCALLNRNGGRSRLKIRSCDAGLLRTIALRLGTARRALYTPAAPQR
jgi:hypothetical protein